MYNNESPEEDSTYRHFYIITSLICQNTWNIKYSLLIEVLQTMGMNERLTALEFLSGGGSIDTYINNFCPTIGPQPPPILGQFPVNPSQNIKAPSVAPINSLNCNSCSRL